MNDTDVSGWADGARVPIANDHSGEELLHRLSAEFGVNGQTAMELLIWFDANLPFRKAEAHERDVTDQTEAQREFISWFKRFAHHMVAYMDKQSEDPKLLRTSVRAAFMTVGLPTVAGADSPTELARVMGLAKLDGGSGKATVHKCCQHFLRHLRQDPMPGARTAEAREKMRIARLRQLNHSNGSNEHAPGAKDSF